MFRSDFASKLSFFKAIVCVSSLSKPVMALTAALALSSLPAATAVAQYRDDAGREFRAGGFRSDGFRGDRFRGDEFRAAPRFAERRGPAARDEFPGRSPRPYAVLVYRDGYYEYYYYGCDRWGWSATPWGWRWRRVNVCYPSY
jgi:hypothetical protein